MPGEAQGRGEGQADFSRAGFPPRRIGDAPGGNYGCGGGRSTRDAPHSLFLRRREESVEEETVRTATSPFPPHSFSADRAQGGGKRGRGH